MTPQMRSLIIGLSAVATTKFYFKQSWTIAAMAGLGAMVLVDFATEKESA